MLMTNVLAWLDGNAPDGGTFQPRISRTASAVTAASSENGIRQVVMGGEVAVSEPARALRITVRDELDEFGVLIPAGLARRQGGGPGLRLLHRSGQACHVAGPQRFERTDDEAHRRAAAIVDHDLVEIMSNRRVFLGFGDDPLALAQVGP